MLTLAYYSGASAIMYAECTVWTQTLNPTRPYQMVLGLIWPKNAKLDYQTFNAGVIWTGKKTKAQNRSVYDKYTCLPGPWKPLRRPNFDRDCRHTNVDGTLTGRIKDFPLGPCPGDTMGFNYFRVQDGTYPRFCLGWVPYVEQPHNVFDNKDLTFYRQAWNDGYYHYTSGFWTFLDRSTGKYDYTTGVGVLLRVDPLLNEVKSGYVAWQKGENRLNKWWGRNFTVQRWYSQTPVELACPTPRSTQDFSIRVPEIRLNDWLPDPGPILGDLSRRSISSLRVNPTSFVTDLIDTVLDLASGGLKGFSKAVLRSNLRNAKDVTKVASSAYLFGKYGVWVPGKSAIESIRNIAAGAKSSGMSTKCYASGKHSYGLIDTTYRCRIMVDPWPDSVLQFIDSLYRLSFGVTLKDLWDLIPLSFVVDWVWGTDSYLTTLQRRTDMLRYNIRGCSYSIKSYLPLELRRYVDESTGWEGCLYLVDYQRFSRKSPILPDYNMITPSLDGLSNNWLDATALVVQKLF